MNWIELRAKVKKRYLIIKCWIVHVLCFFDLIPCIWYQCELDLAEIRAKEMFDFFNSDDYFK